MQDRERTLRQAVEPAHRSRQQCLRPEWRRMDLSEIPEHAARAATSG